jgi:AraC-like DNA-binding protein
LSDEAKTVSLIPRSAFSTDSLPKRDRFDAWRALFSAHDLDADPHGFAGSIETSQISSMFLRVMNASPQGPGRSRSKIRQDGQEGFVLLLSQHSYSVETDRGLFDVPAGAVSLNDLSQPYRRSRVPETDSLIIGLPRAAVAALLPDEDALHGLALTGGMGHLFADHMRSLAAHRRELGVAEAPHLAQATLHLFAACVRPCLESSARASAPLDAARLRIAKRFVRNRLTAPLQVDQITKALGLSRSQLYRLFEPEGGVARYLLRQRLAAVQAALDDPRDLRSISEIGADYGFNSNSHLSRAFREAYGQSPRDYRASGSPVLFRS